MARGALRLMRLRIRTPSRACALPYLAALAAGAAMPLAFAPWSLWALAPLPLAVVFHHASRASPRQAFGLGYLFGVGLFGLGVSWVHVSMMRFGGGGPAVAIGATIAFVALLAVFPALALAVGRWLRSRSDALGLLLVLPAAWVLLEWTRTWAFTGFPWLLLGYSQTGSPVGAAVAPVFGVLGASWIVAFTAGALAWAAADASWRRWGVVLGAAGAFWLLASAAADGQWTQAEGPAFEAALVQGNVDQAVKWQPDRRAEILERYRDLTAPLWGTELVVWPETAIPTWYGQVRDGYIADLQERARETGTEIVLGVPTRQRGRAYNSALTVGTGPVYHKRHLVPFGEYVPFRSVLGDLLDVLGAPGSDFAAGTKPVLLPAAGYRAGVAICYEIAFGAETAALVPGANMLVNISNDAWFGDSIGPRQHLQIARMRAMELERYLLRATNTGLTAIVDPRGRVVAQAPAFERTVLSGRVVPRSGMTPYARWTDAPVLLALAVVLGIAFIAPVIQRTQS